jgi:hypothetical protein
MLQLAGEVKQEDYNCLCDNLTPDDKQLTARTKDDRRFLTDFTFDASESVSLAYETQCKTVDRVFIATGNESLRAAKQQQ